MRFPDVQLHVAKAVELDHLAPDLAGLDLGLNPIIEPMIAAATQSGDNNLALPSRETWYELYDSVTG